MPEDHHTISESVAREVLSRAVELDAKRPVFEGVSLGDLRVAASEAGFDSATVERAIAETLRRSGTQEESVVEKKGMVFSYFTISLTVEAHLSHREAVQVAELNTPYTEREPTVREEVQLSWWTDRRRFRFELDRQADRTKLRVRSPRVLGDVRPWKAQAERAIRRLEAITSFVAAAAAASDTRTGRAF